MPIFLDNNPILNTGKATITVFISPPVTPESGDSNVISYHIAPASDNPSVNPFISGRLISVNRPDFGDGLASAPNQGKESKFIEEPISDEKVYVGEGQALTFSVDEDNKLWAFFVDSNGEDRKFEFGQK